MIMTTSSDPHLRSTSVLEDTQNHDEVVGLKLSYALGRCYFAVLVTGDFASGSDGANVYGSNASIILDLIARFNEACTWTEGDRTIEDIDRRLDSIWHEAEELVRAGAFERIKKIAGEHDRQTWDGGSSQHVLTDYIFPQSFTLQLVPQSQGVSAISRPDLPTSFPFAVEPMALVTQGLLCIEPSCVQILGWHRTHVLKVQIDGDIFCCKLNNTGSQNSFQREFETLRRIRESALWDTIKVPKLRGVVKVEDGVIGLLTDWIETEGSDMMVRLKQKNDLTPSIKRRWASEITRTIEQLHSIGLKWGDAKTSNILIDEYQCPWLIDFGGGFTRGWVDETLNDTEAGDLQGLENTLLDIFGGR